MPALDLSNVCPVLHPANWPGRDACVCRPLVPGRMESPLVAFGLPRAGAIAYPAPSAGWSLDALETYASENVRVHRGRPRWVPHYDPDYEAWLLVKRGDERTASELLDPEELRRAQEHLRAGEVCLAIPARTCLVAFAPEDASMMGLFARREYDRVRGAGGPAVTPLVFAARDGRVADVR